MNTYQQWLLNEIAVGTEGNEEAVSSQAMKWYAGAIATKLGEKAGTYQPLIRALAAKPNLLALLMQLIDELGSMRTSVASNLQSRFQKHQG